MTVAEANVLAGAVDADVHVNVPSARTLTPYLTPHWQEYTAESGFAGTDGVRTSYPPGAPTTTAPDAQPADGSAPASRLEHVQADVLDRHDLACAVLVCYYGVEQNRHPDFAAAVAAAVNDWLVDAFLDRDPRLRGSIVVPSAPGAAAQEIERVGGHPGFVQVLLPVRSERLYGNREYHQVLDAIVRHELVAGLHFGGVSGHPPTANGWPSYYLEEYVGMVSIFQSQLMSLVTEGAFDRFPDLRVALLESGFSWVPSLLWRMDKEWKGIRRETPWVKRLPSEYVRDHVRATLEPIDLPRDRTTVREVLGQIDSDEFLLYSSDYPHLHREAAHDPDVGFLLEGLDEDQRTRLLRGNAIDFYRISGI